MQKILLTFLITSAAYLFVDGNRSTATVTAPIQPQVSPPYKQTGQPAPELGSEANPLILALAPSPHPTVEMVAVGESLASQLEELSGYHIVTVIPASEIDVVKAFDINNAHIAVLTPFAYLQARKAGTARAALANMRDGEVLYGAQFIARNDASFTSYFDPTQGKNTAEESVALAQFNDEKPCWTDTASPSGYVVPLGYLNQAKVQIRSPAFLEGQGPVVRAVYADGICDFGATYIDARQLSTLEADYPDVMEKVDIIWRIPPIIPYEIISFASSLPPEIDRVLLRAFVDLMGTEDGKSAIQIVYDIDTMQPTEDGLYDHFETHVDASGLDLETLLK
jgi:phosphonate transport system substrate-binding protein